MQFTDAGLVGGGHIVGFACANGCEQLVLHGFPSHKINVPGGGVVLRIMQAIGIHKMGALAAKLLGALIHQIHKTGDGAGYSFGQHIGDFIGGNNQQAVQKFLHCQCLTGFNTGGAAVFVNAVDGYR